MSRMRIPFKILPVILLATVCAKPASADQGGVSFWVPGFFGSLAAAPQQPGWSVASIYYHTSVSSGGGVSLPFGAQVAVGLNGRADLGFVAPQYVFATPVLGGQAAVAVAVPFGRSRASAEATFTGPLGNVFSGSRTDEVSGLGDLAPMASLRWNHGVHNVMTYVSGNVRVGTYNPDRLANLGLGHQSLDGGIGYTYFDPQKGHEFSAVFGVTYNWLNKDTDYRNGTDYHIDWAASQFLSKQLLVGIVGYYYDQFSADSGSPPALGPIKSRVAGIGPQLGYIFPLGDKWQGYVNLKGYYEFEAKSRPEGWNVWLTFAISPAAPHQPAAAPARVTK